MALPYNCRHLVVEEVCHECAERVLLPLALPPFFLINVLELEIELHASYTSSLSPQLKASYTSSSRPQLKASYPSSLA
jgi:hypothetical protein